MQRDLLTRWRQEAEEEVRDNILGFWLRHCIDPETGRLVARMSNHLEIEPQAPLGLILTARLLWTFAAAWGWQATSSYRAMAQRAAQELLERFLDREHGGFFWMVGADGVPADTEKKVYGQAFVVYALAETARALGDQGALEEAQQLFELLEDRCRDVRYDGYFESFEQSWAPAQEQRLSEVDMVAAKSMNTHLHVLEAYTNLYRVWPEPRLAERLHSLIELFLDHIVDATAGRQRLFFDRDWHCLSHGVSFGHDIEASWLLTEAAEVLGHEDLNARVREVAVVVARQVSKHGIDDDGGLLYEATTSGELIDDDKHWWPQAEAVVGFVNAYEISGDESLLQTGYGSWQFIRRHIVDTEHGEWFSRVSRNRVLAADAHKISEWKGPYHNGRCCFEVMRRLTALLH